MDLPRVSTEAINILVTRECRRRRAYRLRDRGRNQVRTVAAGFVSESI